MDKKYYGRFNPVIEFRNIFLGVHKRREKEISDDTNGFCYR